MKKPPSPMTESSSESAAGVAGESSGARGRTVLNSLREALSRGAALLGQTSYFARLLGLTTLLLLFGLFMVLSSSTIDSYNQSDNFFAMFLRQGSFAMIGFPLMLVLSRVPMAFWRTWANIIYVGAIGMQLLVFTPLGFGAGGNRNWINIAGINIQPSEALKLAMIIWMASVLSKRHQRLTSVKEVFWPAIPGAGIALGSVVAGQDLGTASVMVIIMMGVLFFAGVPMRFLVSALVLGGAIVAGFVATSANRIARISSWLEQDECTDYIGTCWQIMHGKWALSAGGIFGAGLGNSKAKWSWLPAAENDFIFAVIGEELGLVGGLVVILLFLALAWVFVKIILHCTSVFNRIVVSGVMVWIVGQAFVNIAVVLGILPVLGVPLPLISYGGSALLSGLAAIGVVLAICREEDVRESL